MKPNRREQVIALITEKGEVGLEDVYSALGIQKVHASVLLLSMTDKGQIERLGTNKKYRYKLKAAVPAEIVSA